MMRAAVVVVVVCRLLARAVASNIDANFLKVVASAIVDKYIGESGECTLSLCVVANKHISKARVIREMFGKNEVVLTCALTFMFFFRLRKGP
jgi:hypothetical protein